MLLEHVNLTVSDLDRSVGFYRDLFDFKLRWRGKTADGRNAAHVGDDRCYVALFEAEHPGRAVRDYADIGMNHFGFIVDDLRVMKTRLASRGVTPHSEQEYEPGRRLYFLDPDGIEVELVEYDSPA